MTTRDENVIMADKRSQTDIVSLNRCDSCASAILSMKNMLQFFEEQKHSKERLKPQFRIYDITQFGCMLKISSTIQEYFTNLFEQLHTKERKNVELVENSKELDKKLVESCKKIDFLNEEMMVFKEKYEISQQEKYCLQQKQDTVLADNISREKQIEILYQQKRELESDLQMTQNKLNQVTQENTKLLRCSGQLKNLVNQHILKKKTQFDKTDDINLMMVTILDQYQSSFSLLNLKLSKLNKYIEKCDLKTKKSRDTFNELLTIFSSFEDKYKHRSNQFLEKITELKKNEVEPSIQYKIKGNPADDLSRQIEENLYKIKELQSENVRLEQLIVRFKGIKKCTQ